MARASTKSPTAANGVVALTPDTVDSAPLHPQEVQNNRTANTGKLREFHNPCLPDQDSKESYPLV
jgi:hypothetical protein